MSVNYDNSRFLVRCGSFRCASKETKHVQWDTLDSGRSSPSSDCGLIGIDLDPFGESVFVHIAAADYGNQIAIAR